MNTIWRTNLYAATCSVCGDSFANGQGFFRTEMGSRHFYCVKHKEAYDRDPSAVLDQVPALRHATPTMAPTPMSVDEVAERTASLTFTKVADHFTQHVPSLVQAELLKMVKVAEIKVGKSPSIKLDGASHIMLPTIVQALVSGASPFLVGPAGSGKTTLAEQCAKALTVKFYCEARVTSEFKLMGYMDANGKYVRTSFREAYENGGMFLFDEVDASEADAMTGFNSALSNGYCSFPDGMVHRHKNFYAIAAGNTYGRGADRQYVGRTQLDAATLDRFQIFEVDYDEALEHTLAGDLGWSTYVQAVRKAVAAQQVRHLVTPRASIVGARMLASGMDRQVVENATIWKGLAGDVRQRIEYGMVGG